MKLLGFFNKMMSNFLLSVISIPTEMNTVNDTLIALYTNLNKVDHENSFLDLLAMNEISNNPIDMKEISNNPIANDAFNKLFKSTCRVIDDCMPLRKITNKEFK